MLSKVFPNARVYCTQFYLIFLSEAVSKATTLPVTLLNEDSEINYLCYQHILARIGKN